MDNLAYDAMDFALAELFEVQYEKSEFDNEVVFQYNYKNDETEK